MAAPNSSFDYLATTTLQGFAPEIADNYTNQIGLLWFINKKGGKRVKNGGRSIVEPLAYKKNSTFAPVAKNGTITTTIQDPYSAAEFDWKYVAGSIAYYDPDVQMNRGKEQVYDLLQSLKNDAQLSMKEAIAEQLFADASPSTEFDGLGKILPEDPTSGTVGGINRATAGNEFWIPKVYKAADSSAYDVAAFNTSNEGRIALDKAFLTLVRGTEKPTVEVTTITAYQLYHLSLTTNQRYADVEAANAGFTNLLHFQTPVIFDYYCPTYAWFMLNTNFLKFNVMAGRDAWVEGFYPANDQLTYSSKVATYGNLSCSWAQGHGRLYISG